MVVSVASGKGGTGKTTVAVNLALSIRGSVRLLDCDVEEPNCHIFLRPDIQSAETVGVPVPLVDKRKCTACGECAEICQYNAIAVLKTGVLIFAEFCHGCGGCALICPEGAISEISREIGVVERGCAGSIEFTHGRLRVGEAMSPPLVRAVKKHVKNSGITIIDCPPGTSCPVIAAIKDSDYVILVSEPTPFGLHDLILAVQTVRQMGIPFGVVLNRADIGDRRVHEYCASENIPILLELRDDRRVAEAYSRGQAAIEALPELRTQFEQLYADIRESLRNTLCCGTGGHTDAYV